ncbi:MAG TPA: hypothetical protein VG498_17865, partial [Terriglobales bacterium]|nr:hypothetical protein [Terriglobales bacterium]
TAGYRRRRHPGAINFLFTTETRRHGEQPVRARVKRLMALPKAACTSIFPEPNSAFLRVSVSPWSNGRRLASFS